MCKILGKNCMFFSCVFQGPNNLVCSGSKFVLKFLKWILRLLNEVGNNSLRVPAFEDNLSSILVKRTVSTALVRL
jgi:hypothetical protein